MHGEGTYMQTGEPQNEVTAAAAAMLTNWQPLVALDSNDQGVVPVPEYCS